MIVFHQIAAALYLATGLGALVGIVLPAPRMTRGAALGLWLAVVVHGVGFATLHRGPTTPSLTDLPLALSLMAWMAAIFLLILRWRVRLPGFIAAVGPLAFLATFAGALRLSGASGSAENAAGSIPHAHVLLASAGLSLLGIAGVAGLFYLLEHRRLKSKRPVGLRIRLPSLEALDRVNAVTLAVGVPLLSLGVLTGMVWVHDTPGAMWLGTSHQTWTLLAWAIYSGLAVARFAGDQGARKAAASAVAGFAFLLFAVVGVGLLV